MLRTALLGLLLFALGDGARFPARLVDVDGQPLALGALASDAHVFVVTLKRPSCPVCSRQLERLLQQQTELALCGARFVVLSPGPADAIRALRQATPLAARWVEDGDLALGRALGLVLGPGELVPAILEVDAQGRVLWVQRGRSGIAYGDAALRERLDCVSHAT